MTLWQALTVWFAFVCVPGVALIVWIVWGTKRSREVDREIASYLKGSNGDS